MNKKIDSWTYKKLKKIAGFRIYLGLVIHLATELNSWTVDLHLFKSYVTSSDWINKYLKTTFL